MDNSEPGTRRRSVLILEDEFFLADDLRIAALDAEFSPMGPFSSAQQGMHALHLDRPDGAIIDIKLSDGEAFEAVRHLVAEEIPVVFVTGYGQGTIPVEFRSIPLCLKPCHAAEAIDCLKASICQALKSAAPELLAS